MEHPIVRRDVRILIVEQSLTMRQSLIDTMNELGFGRSAVLGSCADALAFFEYGEKADWILAPLVESNAMGSVPLLSSLLENKEFGDVCFSPFTKETDRNLLPVAFEAGALSWHPTSFTKQGLKEEVQLLLSRLQRAHGNTALVASSYLAKNLAQLGLGEELEAHTKAILDLYPCASEAFLPIIHSHLLRNDVDGAVQSAERWLLVEPEAAQEIGFIEQDQPEFRMAREALVIERQASEGRFALGSAPSAGAETASPAQAHGQVRILGLEGSCVVVDPDQDACDLIRQLLLAFGADDVRTFEDGESAAAWLASNREPAIVIQEWRIPRLTGPFLLQRLREQGHIRTPVVVVSSLIKKGEALLLREMGVSSILPKPFDRTAFLQTLLWTVQQSRGVAEQRFLERRILVLLEEGNLAEARKLAELHRGQRGVSESGKLLVDAHIAYAEEQWKKAVDLATAALHLTPDSILLLEKALQLDAGSGRVAHTEASFALMRGDTSGARKALARVPNVDRFLSSMNNKAVAFIRCHEFDAGIRLYEEILSSIPENQARLLLSVSYNLALAHARCGQAAEASSALLRYEGLSPKTGGTSKDEDLQRLLLKRRSLGAKLRACLEEGAALVVSDVHPEVLETAPPEGREPAGGRAAFADTVFGALESIISVREGRNFLRGIFKVKGPMSGTRNKLLAGAPRFRPKTRFQRA